MNANNSCFVHFYNNPFVSHSRTIPHNYRKILHDLEKRFCRMIPPPPLAGPPAPLKAQAVYFRAYILEMRGCSFFSTAPCTVRITNFCGDGYGHSVIFSSCLSLSAASARASWWLNPRCCVTISFLFFLRSSLCAPPPPLPMPSLPLPPPPQLPSAGAPPPLGTAPRMLKGSLMLCKLLRSSPQNSSKPNYKFLGKNVTTVRRKGKTSTINKRCIKT